MMYSILKGYKKEILGISPDANILSIKILDEDESIKSDKIYEAINFAVEQKVTIINLSVASYKYNDQIAEAIKTATQNNITVIASSGDYSDVEIMFPASMEEVVSVGAIDEKLEFLEMTSGPKLTTINAPGDNIQTLGLNNEVFPSSGTSQATALISGYVALLKDYAAKKNYNLTNEEIIIYLTLIKDNKMTYTDIFEKEIK